jgi:glycosyltransferase involved in cell wall biosynthesis
LDSQVHNNIQHLIGYFMSKILQTSLSVIVPVFNEEYLVEESLKRLFVLDESPFIDKIQIIIINDGSTDHTGQIIKNFLKKSTSKKNKFEWKYIEHIQNSGKGKAIQSGLNEASCEITIFHDADLEYYPKDILRMIPLFIEEGADAVFGSRFAVYEYRRILMFRHEIGNKLLTFFSNIISNLNLTDMETCYKAVRTDLLKSIPIISNDFRIEPELTIKLAKRDAKIFEVPINYSGRTYQEGKKINWKDGIKAIFAILKFGFSDDIFTEDEYGSKILTRLSRTPKFNTWMAQTIAPYVGQNVLEIGAGTGNLTKMLIPRHSYYATDINPLYLQMFQKLKTDKPYLSVQYLDLNNVAEFKEKDNKFDTIICLNVIEHLDDDEQALKNIAGLLSDQGKAIILVPRGQDVFGTLDEVLGHKRRYSEKAIRLLSQKAGVEVEKIIPFNRASTIPWWINGKILKKKTFSLFQLFCMNLMTPILKKIDHLLPVPSLSYIVILKKTIN